ncbi:MAG: twin transmembrane helix small protein [Rhodocyclaceae bacterium]|nr:twin transmembrane helix small protein [Rhodocyclaceae bacterium]
MRIVVILFLIAIIASLTSALVFLFRDQGRERKRMVKALALRVGLSIMLFVILTAGYYSGLITDKL